MSRKFLTVDTLPSQVSLGFRDGEVYPASLVIPQRFEMTQTDFRQVVCSQKSVQGNINEKVLTKWSIE